MADQQYTKLKFRNFAEQIKQSVCTKSLNEYALVSLLDVMEKEGVEDLDENILKLWIADMAIKGKKVSTCKRYFGKIHTLYNEWCNTTDNNKIFEAVSPVFSELRNSDTQESVNNLNFVKRLIDKTEQSDDRQLSRIFFYLLYNPSASLADVVNLTFTDAPRFCPQIDDIINSSNSSHGRKYVFRLKQGKSRPHEIAEKLTKDLGELLTAAGMRFENGFSRSSISSLWIAAALKCGLRLQLIRNCVGMIPKEYAMLTLVEKGDISEFTKEAVICTVADSINNFATRWFVMKLRQGVSVNDIKERIDEKLPGRLSSMSLFYPTRAEIRKEGNKRIIDEVPFLPNVLFFRTQSNKLKSLFANIGDLAWCFKASNSADSEYAVIPHKQMQIFQQCIGNFTSDIKMELVNGSQSLERGRKVKVTGGIMAGYEGEIIDIKEEPGKRMFFLSISDNLRARWTAHVEDVFLQPIA